MKFVLEQVKQKENRQMISVIRMEIDYELVTLYDALQANDKLEIIKSKSKLNYLVNRLKNLSKYQ